MREGVLIWMHNAVRIDIRRCSHRDGGRSGVMMIGHNVGNVGENCFHMGLTGVSLCNRSSTPGGRRPNHTRWPLLGCAPVRERPTVSRWRGSRSRRSRSWGDRLLRWRDSRPGGRSALPGEISGRGRNRPRRPGRLFDRTSPRRSRSGRPTSTSGRAISRWRCGCGWSQRAWCCPKATTSTMRANGPSGCLQRGTGQHVASREQWHFTTAAYAVPPERWTHLAFVRRRAVGRAYVNGRPFGR